MFSLKVFDRISTCSEFQNNYGKPKFSQQLLFNHCMTCQCICMLYSIVYETISTHTQLIQYPHPLHTQWDTHHMHVQIDMQQTVNYSCIQCLTIRAHQIKRQIESTSQRFKRIHRSRNAFKIRDFSLYLCDFDSSKMISVSRESENFTKI
jgi:hypothetical protein